GQHMEVLMAAATLYHLKKAAVNGDDTVRIDLASPPPPVRSVPGAYLAYNRFDPTGKAFLAADLHSGALQLVKPTLRQAAALARANYAYAWHAVKRRAQRAEIEAGPLPLVPPGREHPSSTD